MILQATLAFPLYFGLGLVQYERYLHVQDYKPQIQRRALKYGYYFLRVMTTIYIPQKVVPAAFCLYWLGSSESTDFRFPLLPAKRLTRCLS